MQTALKPVYCEVIVPVSITKPRWKGALTQGDLKPDAGIAGKIKATGSLHILLSY